MKRIDERIGRFVVVRQLGEGAMGVVYEARDPELDRLVAVKVMKGDAEALRMVREAQALAQVAHPNVVTVHELGTDDDRVFLAMARVDGETLARHLAARPRSWRDTLALLIQAGRGLAAVHDAGLVHRDFKPDNVLVDRAGVVRVADFGLARRDDRDQGDGREAASSAALEVTADGRGRALGETVHEPGAGVLATPLTADGAVVGTPRYMAPEQHAAGVVTQSADQFAFGIAVWEALYGEHPFGGDDRDELRRRVLAGKRRAVPARRRVPRAVERVLARSLAVDPAARWPSMPAMLAALEAVPRRRRRLAIAAASLVAAGGLTTAGALLAGPSDPPRVACARAGDELATTWTDAARRDVHDRFVATAPAWGDDGGRIVVDGLDRWADRWRAARIDACQATHDRGEQSPPMLDLRMDCLDGQRLRFDALLAGFARADRSGLERANHAVATLPEAQACAARYMDSDATPHDPRHREVREMIANGYASTSFAVDDARELAQRALAAARELGDPGLLAEALALHARAETGGDPGTAKQSLDEATQLAAQSGDPRIEAEVAIQLVRRVALDGDTTRLDALMPIAQAAVVRAGELPSLVANLNAVRVIAAFAMGGIDESRAACEAATSAVKVVPDLTIQCACLVPLNARDTDGAVTGCEHSVQLAKQTYGERHPQVHERVENYVIALNRAGRSREALAAAEANLALGEALYGARSEAVATGLLNLSAIQHRLGEVAGARASLERALEIHDELALPANTTRASILIELASVLDELGESATAVRRADEAIELGARVLGEDHPSYAVMLMKQGVILTRMAAHLDRGLAALQHAVEVAVRAHGATSPLTGAMRANLAGQLFDVDRPSDALAEADRALAVLDVEGGNPSHIAGSLRVRGASLIALGRRREARAPLVRARALYVALGEVGAAEVARVDAILAVTGRRRRS